MSDFDPTKKLGSFPIYVWIVGGVVASYAVVKWRQSRTTNTTTTPSTDTSSLDYGSSGGSGLASDSPYGTPASVGITAPTPTSTNPVPVYVVPNPKTPTTTVKTPTPTVTKTAPTKVSDTRKTVTTTHPQTQHKRGYTQAQLKAAQSKKNKAAGLEA